MCLQTYFSNNFLVKFLDVQDNHEHALLSASSCMYSLSINLALLKADSHKIFKSHRIFRPSKNTFYKEILINQPLLCLSQVSYIKIKAFLVILGEFQSFFVKISKNFIKSPLKFWFISQISVHSLWHVAVCPRYSWSLTLT